MHLWLSVLDSSLVCWNGIEEIHLFLAEGLTVITYFGGLISEGFGRFNKGCSNASDVVTMPSSFSLLLFSLLLLIVIGLGNCFGLMKLLCFKRFSVILELIGLRLTMMLLFILLLIYLCDRRRPGCIEHWQNRYWLSSYPSWLCFCYPCYWRLHINC